MDKDKLALDLAWVCIEECDRAVRQSHENRTKNKHGRYDTNFNQIIKKVLSDYDVKHQSTLRDMAIGELQLFPGVSEEVFFSGLWMNPTARREDDPAPRIGPKRDKR